MTGNYLIEIYYNGLHDAFTNTCLWTNDQPPLFSMLKRQLCVNQRGQFLSIIIPNGLLSPLLPKYESKISIEYLYFYTEFIWGPCDLCWKLPITLLISEILLLALLNFCTSLPYRENRIRSEKMCTFGRFSYFVLRPLKRLHHLLIFTKVGNIVR